MAILNLFDLLAINPELLDGYVLDSRLNRENLNNCIKSKLGSSMPVYTNTKIFKFKLETWFSVHEQNISKLVDTTLFQYNPIDNYDRTETVENENSSTKTSNITVNQDISDSHSGKDTEVSDIKNGGSDSTSSNSGGDSTLSKSAYNVEGYSPLETTETSSQDTSSTTYGATQNNTHSKSYGETIQRKGNNSEDRSVADTGTSTSTIHARGNIGVTTTQQMIEQERNISLFNIYDWIVEKLDKELFLGIW